MMGFKAFHSAQATIAGIDSIISALYSSPKSRKNFIASSRDTTERAVTVMEVAQSIGSGLAKATLAGRVNDELVDASTLIENDATIILTTLCFCKHILT
jgi:adenylyl- and sulfurtransferase ThiI